MLVSELDMIVRGAFINGQEVEKRRALDNAKVTARGKAKRDVTKRICHVCVTTMSFFTPKTGSTAESVPKHTVDPRLQPWVEK